MIARLGIRANGFRSQVVPATDLVIIGFPTVSGTFVESPAGTWGNGIGYGVGNKTLPALTDGYVQADFGGNAYRDTVLGLDTVNTLYDWTNFPVGLYISSATGFYGYVENGSSAETAITAVSGDKFRLRRLVAVILGEKTSNGVDWTLVRTFTPTSTALLYIKASIAANPNSLLNPKGLNIS